jgi:hypothetical protein
VATPRAPILAVAAAVAALAVRVPAQGVVAPVTASLSAILAGSPAVGQAFRLYRWDRFPSVLVMDTIDYATQERMFSRLAFFVEKRGFRGSLLTNAELAGRHGWNAHDYGPDGLARFFEAARAAAFPLNPEETTLRDIALAQGILALSRGTYRPGQGAILSISQSSPRVDRKFLLTHESCHGIFFVSAEYRSVCFALWDSLTAAERAFFVELLDELGYDASDEVLAVNELQAYLMQQPVAAVAEYFDRTAERLHNLVPPPTRLAALASRLSEFLTRRFGIEAGATVAAP